MSVRRSQEDSQSEEARKILSQQKFSTCHFCQLPVPVCYQPPGPEAECPKGNWATISGMSKCLEGVCSFMKILPVKKRIRKDSDSPEPEPVPSEVNVQPEAESDVNSPEGRVELTERESLQTECESAGEGRACTRTPFHAKKHKATPSQ